MKVLLSAFACNPRLGSESGVGWHWALEVSQFGHQVWVVTRPCNRAAIEKELVRLGCPPNLKFIYYTLPFIGDAVDEYKFWIYLYYPVWQWGAYRLAKSIHATECFDLVHHISYGGVRVASFMGNLGIPFLFGPIGGGERAPYCLRRGYSFSESFRDAVRDLHNLIIRIDPLMHHTYGKATRIFVKTGQSRSVIPRRYHNKIRNSIEIGCNVADLTSPELVNRRVDRADPFSVLYVGRFIGFKGLNIAVPAFARLVQTHGNARLTLVGRGAMEPQLRQMAVELGIADRIDWVPWVDRATLATIYSRHDMLLFPSLHDSSGNVVLEAMTKGLPVVCLDLGGPAVLVDHRSGVAVDTTGRDQAAVVDSVGRALDRLAGDREYRRRLSLGALERARELTWTAAVERVYEGWPLRTSVTEQEAPEGVPEATSVASIDDLGAQAR